MLHKKMSAKVLSLLVLVLLLLLLLLFVFNIYVLAVAITVISSVRQVITNDQRLTEYSLLSQQGTLSHYSNTACYAWLSHLPLKFCRNTSKGPYH